MATFSDFLTKLRSRTATRIFKIERLDANENVVSELTNKVISGDLNFTDDLGNRKTGNILFDNNDGEFLPSPTSDIWISNKFKISTGLVMDDGTNYFISRGVFLISEIEVENDTEGSSTVRVQFLDKYSALNGQVQGVLENTYIIPVGTSISDSVIQVLLDANEIKPPIIQPTAEVLPYTINIAAGGTYSDILTSICQSLSWTCYFDSDGYFRFEEPADLETTGSSWDFSTDEVTLLSCKTRFDFTEVYNVIVVIGANINGDIIRAVAEDTSPSSATSVSAIGRHVKVIEDDLISTEVLAQQRADAELAVGISIVQAIDFEAMPIDVLEAGQVCTVNNDVLGLSAVRFLVKSNTFPLTIDSDMSLNAWRGQTLE